MVPRPRPPFAARRPRGVYLRAHGPGFFLSSDPRGGGFRPDPLPPPWVLERSLVRTCLSPTVHTVLYPWSLEPETKYPTARKFIGRRCRFFRDSQESLNMARMRDGFLASSDLHRWGGGPSAGGGGVLPGGVRPPGLRERRGPVLTGTPRVMGVRLIGVWLPHL